jgi:hypothetical protein
MEQLPYIDEHSRLVGASRERVWAALPGIKRAQPGFHVAEAIQPQRLELRGSHPFSRYMLVFELDERGTGQSLLRAQTWAVFPGFKGRIYRALVIGSGGHRIAVRLWLRQIARSV